METCKGSKYPNTHNNLPHTDSKAGMEVARNKDLSSLSLSKLVYLGYTNYLYYDGDCKKWILRSPDDQDQLRESFKMTEEEIKSQPTYTEKCDVCRCPLQEVEGQELGGLAGEYDGCRGGL